MNAVGGIAWRAFPNRNRARIMRRNDILRPASVLREARRARVGPALACALLEQESGGGHNVFGHDRGMPFEGAGEVTKEKYLAYKRERDRDPGRRRMQGVGPMQLTWWEFQDETDRMGGCWRPAINMRFGFRLVANLVRIHGLRGGVRRYNGSGPAAEAYADSVLDRYEKWQRLLAPPRPAGWRQWVEGDTDVSRRLARRLGRTGRRLGQPVYIASGKRSFAEQTVLWDGYQRCLREGRSNCIVAARPGTSRHESGDAADCRVGARNIGDYDPARDALRAEGLCLPVAGEPWHVERGTTWRA